MRTFLLAGVSVFSVLLALALLLSISGRLGRAGRAVAGACTRTPGLDVIVSLFTWVPWVAVGVAFGWRGLLGAILGQVTTLGAWVVLHELTHRDAARGPRIVKFLNREIGRWRNHAALWVTSIALPGFLFIRFLEVACYPMLVVLLNFPKYKQAEWVNVSRQKFDGLVGHDLIWCLYCDWMTGVYSLGAEMLRNVESFWCPIRFYDGKKCENCKLDFPDVAGGWVPATATMRDVEQTMETHYGTGQRAWFGHPTRITVKGSPLPDGNGNGHATQERELAADAARRPPAVPQA
jgi:hypothetical protein